MPLPGVALGVQSDGRELPPSVSSKSLPLGGQEGRPGGWAVFQGQELQGARTEQEGKKSAKAFIFSWG